MQQVNVRAGLKVVFGDGHKPSILTKSTNSRRLHILHGLCSVPSVPAASCRTQSAFPFFGLRLYPCFAPFCFDSSVCRE